MFTNLTPKFLLCFLIFVACDFSPMHPGVSNIPKVIRIGAILGPEAKLMEAVKEVALKRYQLEVEVVSFNDLITPNFALQNREIDMSAYQNKLSLDTFIEIRKANLMALANTFIYPMAGYSSKVKSLADLSPYAEIAIPDEATNQGRALLLLAKQGMIRLAPGAGLLAQPSDIIYNPRKLRFLPMEASQVPRAINEVDMVIMNAINARTIRLEPLKDGLFAEDDDSPYAHVIVLRQEDRRQEWAQKLMEVIRSDEVLEAAKKIFGGNVIRASANVS